jgi:hypothetical protein
MLDFKTYSDYVMSMYPQVPAEFHRIVMFCTGDIKKPISDKVSQVFHYQNDSREYGASYTLKSEPILLWGKKGDIEESGVYSEMYKKPHPKKIYNNVEAIVTSKKDLLEIYQNQGHDFIPKTSFNKKKAAREIGFPMIAKSLNSFQSRGVEKVSNSQELQALSADYDLFQEQIKIQDEYRLIFFRGFTTPVTLLAAFHREPINQKSKGLREAMTQEELEEKEASEFKWTQVSLKKFNRSDVFSIASTVFLTNPFLNVVGIDLAFENERAYYIEQNITPGLISNVPFLLYKFVYEDAFYSLDSYTIKRLQQLSYVHAMQRMKESDDFEIENPSVLDDFQGLCFKKTTS